MRRLELTLLPFLLLACLRGHAAPFQAGSAAVDITPPVGWRMSGYFYERFSGGIHDPLEAKAIVLRHGDERGALVFCDLIGMPGFVSDAVRERAGQKTGVPKEHILIAATHSHTGPLFYGALRDYLHARAVQRGGQDYAERLDYRGILIDRLVSVISQADRAAGAVEIYVAKTNVPGLSFNRRYHMKNGSVQFNPGKTNDNIVRPAGPTDPELFFLAFKRKADRKIVAGLTSYALHADTVGGTNYGADFPGHIGRFLNGVIDNDVISCFGNGPCGDINHVDVADARPQKGDAEAERIGKLLGRKVIDLFPSLTAIQPALTIGQRPVRIPLQQYSPEQIAEARTNLAKVGEKDLPFLRQVEACKIMDLQWRWPGAKEIKLEVQAFRLGRDTVVVGLPGEIFCELGLAIKQRSPFKNTIIVELANESLGYVPTKKAFGEGSYEIVNSRVQPGGGEMLVDAAVQLLKRL